jgi:hypothetical protein
MNMGSEMMQPSYAESLARLNALLGSVDDTDSPLRAQQLFALIRTAGPKPTGLGRLRRQAARMKQYLACCGLVTWGLVSVLILRMKGLGASVHQGVDLPFANRQDPRSTYVLQLLDDRQLVFFWHFADAWSSLKGLLRNPALACHPESFVRVLWPWHRLLTWTTRSSTVTDNAQQDAMFRQVQLAGSYARMQVHVLSWLFARLGTRRLVTLDDPRNAPVLCRAARSLSIQTMGYMHGKFNAYHVGLTVEAFDTYVVWSEHYRQKIEVMWGGCYPGRVVVSGLTRASLPVMKRAPRRHGEPLQVLWLDEDEVDLDQIRPFFERLSEVQGMHVRLRLKPRPAAKQAGLPDWYVSAFERDRSPAFWDALVHHRIDVVIGCHSTALLEAVLLGVVPLALHTSLDYARDMFEDGLVVGCATPEDLQVQLELLQQPDQVSGLMLRQAIEPFNAEVMPAELANFGFPLRAGALNGTPSGSQGAGACRS